MVGQYFQAWRRLSKTYFTLKNVFASNIKTSDSRNVFLTNTKYCGKQAPEVPTLQRPPFCLHISHPSLYVLHDVILNFIGSSDFAGWIRDQREDLEPHKRIWNTVRNLHNGIDKPTPVDSISPKRKAQQYVVRTERKWGYLTLILRVENQILGSHNLELKINILVWCPK